MEIRCPKFRWIISIASKQLAYIFQQYIERILTPRNEFLVILFNFELTMDRIGFSNAN